MKSTKPCVLMLLADLFARDAVEIAGQAPELAKVFKLRAKQLRAEAKRQTKAKRAKK